MSANSADNTQVDPAANGTIQAILEAGAQCLARFGQDRTSIQVIARAAGLNRTTVYRHFGDREQLFRAIDAYLRDRQRAAAAERIPDDASLEDSLAVIAEMLASTALAFNIPDHLRRHDRGLAQYFGMFGADRHVQISNLIRPYITRARQAGELGPGLTDNEAVDWAALVLMSIETMPDAATLDIKDPVTFGRTFARRICRGIGN